MSNHIMPNVINQHFSGEGKNLAKLFAQVGEVTIFIIICIVYHSLLFLIKQFIQYVTIYGGNIQLCPS